jgi:hypothetical protein
MERGRQGGEVGGRIGLRGWVSGWRGVAHLSKNLLRSLLDDAESRCSLAAAARYLPCWLSRSSSARFCVASCSRRM